MTRKPSPLPLVTDRRRALKLLTYGVGAACAGAAGCSSESLAGDYAGGNVSALSVGSLVIAPGGPIAVGRDSGGVYAMTLVCTHAGCDMSSDGTVSASGVTCSCHGSRFDVDGNVTQGPADAPLQHFQVTIASTGEITIDASAPVPETTRTPVPG